jgi:hypothetical protein
MTMLDLSFHLPTAGRAPGLEDVVIEIHDRSQWPEAAGRETDRGGCRHEVTQAGFPDRRGHWRIARSAATCECVAT